MKGRVFASADPHRMCQPPMPQNVVCSNHPLYWLALSVVEWRDGPGYSIVVVPWTAISCLFRAMG